MSLPLDAWPWLRFFGSRKTFDAYGVQRIWS